MSKATTVSKSAQICRCVIRFSGHAGIVSKSLTEDYPKGIPIISPEDPTVGTPLVLILGRPSVDSVDENFETAPVRRDAVHESRQRLS